MSDNVPTPSNRRRSRRQKPKATTRVVCYANALGLGENVAVSILDLSETGVRLLVKTPLEKDQEVELKLDGPLPRSSFKVLGRVIWSVPAEGDVHCVGIHFQKALNYADLLAFARV